jgi:hypothetical protein
VRLWPEFRKKLDRRTAQRSKADVGDYDMTVQRTNVGHQTRYAMQDGAARRCILTFDKGEDGGGPAVWKILLPGPAGTEDLYGVHEFLKPDAAQLTAWLTPIVGPDAAAELAMAVDAEPPPGGSWQPAHPPGR